MLELRKFEPKDEALLVSYLNDEAQTQFLSARIPQPYTNESAEWWVNTGSKLGHVYAIDNNGIFVGSIGALPGDFEKQRTAEVGYWVARPYWGQGIASEALKNLTHLIFEHTNIIRLFASVIEGNLASAKVLQKNGYKLEAVLEKALYKNGEFFNELHYSKIRS